MKDYQKIIHIYYTALMTYLVFTFANNLFQQVVTDHSLEIILYVILWGLLVIQTTFAYVHIMKIPSTNYTICALISDGLDIGFSVYICAVISGACADVSNYLRLSIPFLLIAVNQFYWYLKVKEFNPSAVFRLVLLFLGMLLITISECISHGIWNLIAIVIWDGIVMGLLRSTEWVPPIFAIMLESKWNKVKQKEFVRKHFC